VVARSDEHALPVRLAAMGGHQQRRGQATKRRSSKRVFRLQLFASPDVRLPGYTALAEPRIVAMLTSCLCSSHH
jgi:hypothetical protein